MNWFMTNPPIWALHPAKTDQPGLLPSLITIFAVYILVDKGFKAFFMRTLKTLIRLSRYPG